MEMDWKTYEEITKYIYETLGEKSGVKILGYGNDCKVKGKSNVNHQIDVLASHSDGIHTYKTAIECKYWKDTVNKDVVMKVVAIIEDAQIDKGVIVSKKGFTEDAIDWARYKNIGLLELREMEEKDWEGRHRLQITTSALLRPTITSIKFIPSLFNKSDIKQEEVQNDVVIIKKHNGEENSLDGYLKEFKNEVKAQPVDKPFRRVYFMPMSQVVNKKTNSILYIDGFTINGFLKRIENAIKFYPKDEIWLIMKSIFEKNTYTISKRGIIKKDD